MILFIKQKIYQILKEAEKYTKTDLIYLARGGFWLTLTQGISSFSAFLLAIAFANFLPPETFGAYKYILSFASILLIPSLPEINTALTQSVARGFEGSFFSALKIRIKWGFLSSFLSLLLSFYYFFRGNFLLGGGFLIATIFLPFFESLGTYQALLLGRKDFFHSAKYNIFSQLGHFLILILSLLISKNLFFILLAYFISLTTLRLFFLKKVLKKYPPNRQLDPETISYGKHLTLMSILGNVAKYLDKLLIFHYLGAKELAIYTFATSPLNHLASFLNNLKVLTFPKFANGEKEKIKSGLRKRLIFLILFLGGIILIYFLLAPYLYRLFFPKYPEAIFYTKIFAFSLIGIIGGLFNNFLRAQKEIKKLYQLSFFAPLYNIAGMFLAVQFGLEGIVIGKVILEIINLIYLARLIRI